MDITVTLPDGSCKECRGGTTPLDIAEGIGAGLARDAVGAKVDGALCDLTAPLLQDCRLEITTVDSEAGLEILRHSTGHVLALAVQRHLYAFYDQPELMHRINRDLTEWILKAIDALCAICTPDFMTFGEDLSYNHGPMLSRELFEGFLRPYYDRIIPCLKDRGIIPMIDSDGDIAQPAHWFADAGLEGVLPLERQSGVDVASLRRDHPQMNFVGHFDKMVMNKGEEALRAEFERLLPVAAAGGFLPSCDHQTPPGVSYQDYRIYLQLFREYARKAGEMSARLL